MYGLYHLEKIVVSGAHLIIHLCVVRTRTVPLFNSNPSTITNHDRPNNSLHRGTHMLPQPHPPLHNSHITATTSDKTPSENTNPRDPPSSTSLSPACCFSISPYSIYHYSPVTPAPPLILVRVPLMGFRHVSRVTLVVALLGWR